jgi:hypothetical protein
MRTVLFLAEDCYFVIDDQVLGKPLADIRHAGVIFNDQLDLFTRDGVSVLLNAKACAVHGGLSHSVKRPRHRLNKPDLDHLLRACRAGKNCRHGGSHRDAD